MTWLEYVRKHAAGETDAAIAARISIDRSAVGRWDRSQPKPDVAARFARAYKRPVLEAFLAAGFLTPEEADQRLPPATATPSTLTNKELLDEIQQRLERRSPDAGQAEVQKMSTDGPATVPSPAEDRVVTTAKDQEPAGQPE